MPGGAIDLSRFNKGFKLPDTHLLAVLPKETGARSLSLGIHPTCPNVQGEREIHPGLLVLSLQTTPMWLPEVFFINSPTPPRIACRCCQKEFKPRGTASLFPSTSWVGAHIVFCSLEINLTAHSSKQSLTPHPSCFHVLILFSLWSLGTQGSLLVTEISFIFLKRIFKVIDL